MGNIFRGSEIIGIGIQIERNGRDFYNSLTQKTKSQQAGEIYGLLAAEEERHISLFEKLLDSAGRFEPQEAYPGEYLEYLNALAGEYVFTQKDKGRELADSVSSDAEAIAMGIEFEKDSILFYEGMKPLVPEYDIETIEGLINEEKRHLKKLAGLKKRRAERKA